MSTAYSMTCDHVGGGRPEDFAGKEIFITGGTGFYGCWLLESFIQANKKYDLNTRLTVLTRSPDLFKKKAPHLATDSAVSLLRGDVRSFDFPDGSFSHIIHAATETDSRFYSDLLEIVSVIISETCILADFAGIVELLMEFEPNLHMPHSRAMGTIFLN